LAVVAAREAAPPVRASVRGVVRRDRTRCRDIGGDALRPVRVGLIVAGGVASAEDAGPAGDESALTGPLLRPVARTAPSVLALGRGLAVVGVAGIGVGILGQSDHTDGELDRGVLGSVTHGVAGAVDDDLADLRFAPE